MIDPEKIKKLIVGSGGDRALANEYIKVYKIDVIPDGFEQLVWDAKYWKTNNNEIYHRDIDNTWYKLENVWTTTSTTTKI